MINIRKNGTLVIDGVKYYLFKNLKGSLLVVNSATKEMALVFDGLNENNIFIPLQDGKKSLSPDNINKLFPKKYDENNHDNYKILLLGREGKKYLLVYVWKIYSEDEEPPYDIESISEVGEPDELIFFAPGQHKIIPLGVNQTFTIKGDCIT